MKYMLESVRSAAKSGDEKKLAANISEAREFATQIISELRSISLDLRPTMLDDLGLSPTVEWLARQISERHELKVEVEANLDESDIEPEIATAVYRIIQEALANVGKHAKATKARVGLELKGDGLLSIIIEDNGVGFDQHSLQDLQTSKGCSGILNMKERARFLGGEFRLETLRGKGTKLFVTIPVKETDK